MPGRRRPDWNADRDLREGINALEDESAEPQSGRPDPGVIKKTQSNESEDNGSVE